MAVKLFIRFAPAKMPSNRFRSRVTASFLLRNLSFQAFSVYASKTITTLEDKGVTGSMKLHNNAVAFNN